jgi:hypothetical protein
MSDSEKIVEVEKIILKPKKSAKPEGKKKPIKETPKEDTDEIIEKLEKLGKKNKKKSAKPEIKIDENYVMEFGKHKGQPLKDLPLDYLCWFYKQKKSDKTEEFEERNQQFMNAIAKVIKEMPLPEADEDEDDDMHL